MKLITKIVGATLGLALAVGVGAGVAANNKVAKQVSADGETWASTSVDFELATSISSGDQIIIVSTYEAKAMGAQTSNNRSAAAVTKTGNSVSNKKATPNAANSVALLTVGTHNVNDTDYYTFAVDGGYLYDASTSSKNYLRTQNTVTDNGYADWTVSINASGIASITARSAAASKYVLSYNSGSSLFACYASLQSNGGLEIYKKPTVDPSKTVQANSVTIKMGDSQISGTYEPTSTYTVGDTMNLTSSTVSYQQGDEYQDGEGSINWSSSSTNVATVSNGIVTFVGAGTTTITATAADPGEGDSIVSASFVLDIENIFGGINNPYNIAQAKAAIDAGTGVNGVCVAGVVSQVDSYNSTYHSVTYWISDDGTTEDQFEVYGGLGLNGADFSSKDDVQLGADVIVKGNIKKFNSIYEFDKDNIQVYYNLVVRYDITFNSNGGSSVATQKVVAGQKAQRPTDPTKASDEQFNYTFVNWYKNSDFSGSAYDFDDPVNSSFTLYAKWNATLIPAKEVIERDLSTRASLGYHYGKEGSDPDALNREFTGVSGTNYTSWEDKAGLSGAVYAGNSAGGNDSIQLRKSSNSQDKSAIVSTTSGGKISKVTVAWNSNTAAGRTLAVYGKNSAYNSPDDMYNNSNQGTLLGTIVKGTSTELTISGDYEYIGVVSNDGAMYLDSIRFQWGEPATYTYSDVKIRFSALISDSLWERLDDESDIQGYGVMISYEDLGSNSIQDLYDEAKTDQNTIDEALDLLFDPNDPADGVINGRKYYKPASQKTDGHPDEANANQKAGAEGTQYIWFLNQDVTNSLTTPFTAVTYIRVADDIVFLDEVTASAKSLAADLISSGKYNESTAEGSLLNLSQLA